MGEGKTTVELLGLHRRKVLQRLAWMRRELGQPIGDTALWTMAMVDIAASIYGAGLTLLRVDGVAARLNVPMEREAAARLVQKAGAEIFGVAGFRPMTSKTMGALVRLTAKEKASIGAMLNLKRISIEAIDHVAADLERRRNRAQHRRAASAAEGGKLFTPREQSKAAQARSLGVDRSTLFRRAVRADATVSCPLPEGGSQRGARPLFDATVSCPLPGEMQRFRAPYQIDSNGHETVASPTSDQSRKKNGEAA